MLTVRRVMISHAAKKGNNRDGASDWSPPQSWEAGGLRLQHQGDGEQVPPHGKGKRGNTTRYLGTGWREGGKTLPQECEPLELPGAGCRNPRGRRGPKENTTKYRPASKDFRFREISGG